MDDLTVDWITRLPPDALPVMQASGFCFDGHGRLLLIEHKGVFSLPGGKPESSESWEQTLRREVVEEANVLLGDVRLLGYQRVEHDRSVLQGAPYAQIRTVASVTRILPSLPDPASGVTYSRHFCSPESVPGLLRWIGRTAEAQVADACRLAHEIWSLPIAVIGETSGDGRESPP